MQRSLEISEQLAVQNADLSEQMRADSRTLKALSLIATVYLPASLVAVSSCQSLLLQLQAIILLSNI